MRLEVQRLNYAYVKLKKSGKYSTNLADGKLLEVSIDKAIRIQRDDRKTHDARSYWSLNPDEDKRYRLKVHSVRHQFENYNQGEGTSEFDRSYDESMSHKCVIEALSRLKTMRLMHIEGNVRKPMAFEFRTVKKTPYLKLPNGEKYYPDLLCIFGEDSEFYDKWGGKLAIEVTYTHGCESYKEEDFMFHNIPVFEVTIEDGSARQFPAERPNWPKGKSWGEELVENHIKQLVEWFSKNVVGQLTVNPTSSRVHIQEMEILNQNFCLLRSDSQKLASKYKTLQLTHENVISKLGSITRKYEAALHAIENFKDDKDTLKKKNVNLSEDLDILKTASNNKILTLKNKLEVHKWHEFQKYILYSLVIFMVVVMLLPFLFPESSKEILNIWFKTLVQFRLDIF